MNASYNCSPKYNWLTTSQLFITPNIYYAFSVKAEWYVSDETNNGTLQDNGVYNNFKVRPTLYLTSNTLITGGTGLSTNPYIIG